jgi:hypothetical protein
LPRPGRACCTRTLSTSTRWSLSSMRRAFGRQCERMGRVRPSRCLSCRLSCSLRVHLPVGGRSGSVGSRIVERRGRLFIGGQR